MSHFSDTVTKRKPDKLEESRKGRSGALIATYKSAGVKAIMKLSKSSLPDHHTLQRGLSVRMQPLREVAYYELAKLGGIDHLVPETVITTAAVPGHIASAQQFVPAQTLKDLNPELKKAGDEDWPGELVKTTRAVPHRFWRQLLALDITAGSRDRHANNIGIQLRLENDRPVYRLVAWDNACSFGLTFARYNSVFHKYLFRSTVKSDDIWPIWDRFTYDALEKALGPYLTPREIAHAHLRTRFFRDFSYRLPFSVCSKGHDDAADFPDYRAFFEPVVERPLHLARVSA